MQNSIYLALNQKYLAGQICSKKIKIVSSNWNLVLRLIWILRIQKAMLAFPVSDRKCLFWANLVPKIKIISLSWNLIPILIGMCRIQWCCSICLFRPASFFVQKLHLPFWYCLINLSAVYLQRLEASGFSCYKCNY